jgi:hypothetical protein
LDQAPAFDGNPSVAFAQTTLVKLELAITGERRKIGRAMEIQDMIMRELDMLILMLMAECVLIPIALLALGDLLLIVLYAGAMSLVAFVILLASLGPLERADVQRRARVRSMEDEMSALRRYRTAR